MSFDYLSPFYLPIYFIHKAGLYQEKDSTYRYRVYGFLMFVLFSSATISHIIRIFKIFAVGDIKELANSLNITMTLFAVNYKALWFVANLKNMKGVLVNLLELCSHDETKENLRLKKQCAKVKKMVKIYFGTAFLAISVNILWSAAHFRNRELPYEASTHFDSETSLLLYWIMFFYQTLTAFYGVVVNYSADLVPVIFMALVTGLLEDLSDDMKNVFKRDDSFKKPTRIESEGKLKMCIEHHVKVTKMVENISKHFSGVVFWQAILSSVILCTSVFLLTIVSFSLNPYFLT